MTSKTRQRMVVGLLGLVGSALSIHGVHAGGDECARRLRREVQVSEGGSGYSFVANLCLQGQHLGLSLELTNESDEPVFFLDDKNPSVGGRERKTIVELGSPHYHDSGIPKLHELPPGGTLHRRFEGLLVDEHSEMNFVSFIFYLIGDDGDFFKESFAKLDGDDQIWFVPVGGPLWKHYYERLISEDITFSIVPLKD